MVAKPEVQLVRVTSAAANGGGAVQLMTIVYLLTTAKVTAEVVVAVLVKVLIMFALHITSIILQQMDGTCTGSVLTVRHGTVTDPWHGANSMDGLPSADQLVLAARLRVAGA